MATNSWILLADRTQAKVLHVLEGGRGPFPQLACFEHEEGRQRLHERDSDKPGRVVHPEGGLSAVEPHEDREHVEAKRFAAQLVDHLEQNRQEGRFSQLFVVAPPKFLGVLRDAWTPSLRKLVTLESHHDLMTLPGAELQRRLEELISAPVA